MGRKIQWEVVIVPNADWIESIQYFNEDGNNPDLSSHNAQMDIADGDGNVIVQLSSQGSPDGTIALDSNANLTFDLPRTFTTTLNAFPDGKYTLVLIEPDGDIIPWIVNGPARVTESQFESVVT